MLHARRLVLWWIAGLLGCWLLFVLALSAPYADQLLAARLAALPPAAGASARAAFPAAPLPASTPHVPARSAAPRAVLPAPKPRVPFGGPEVDEDYGAGNPVIDHMNECDCGNHPVNADTGNFWHTFTDFAIPGRGPGLLFQRTYNSFASNANGTLGLGWTHDYSTSVVPATGQDEVYQVNEENGSTVSFYGDYTTDPYVLATLTQTGGSFIFTHLRGQTRYYFHPLSYVPSQLAGRLYQIVDRNGYSTSLSYIISNTTALLSTVSDAANRQLSFSYTVTNNVPYLTKVADPLGRSVSFGFDSAGNLQTATDVIGKVTHFTYDYSGGNPENLLTMTYPNGGTVTNLYEATGHRVVSQTDPLGRTTTYGYGCVGNCMPSITTVTNDLGYTTVFSYYMNTLGTIVKNPGPGQEVWQFGHLESPGVSAVNILTATDPLSHTWTYTYDAQSNLTRSTDPLGRTTRYAYNATNDLLVVTDSLQIPITYTRDVSGNLLSVARPLTQTGQVARTSFTYDPAHPGDVISSTNPLSATWRTDHDPTTGDVLTSTDPLGDAGHFSYDPVGRVLRAVDPRGYTSAYTYTAYDAPAVVTDTRGYTTTFTYDADRNLKTVSDANGHTVTQTYDLDDERTRTTYADGTHSDVGYDAAGQVISQTNPLSQTTRYSYDLFAHLIASTDPLTRTTRAAYDLADRPVVITDALGLTTTNGYDSANQLLSITYQGVVTTPKVSFAYTPLGLRSVLTDGTGTSRYTYDSLDRLSSAQNGAAQTVSYGYDLAANLTQLTYPSGVTLTRQYDGANRLVKLTDWLGHKSGFSYDPDGDLMQITYPNVVTGTLAYDAGDLLSAITHTNASGIFLALTYTHDKAALLKSAAESGVGTATYNYDARNRLTQDQILNGAAHTRTWSYDGATEITQTTYLTTGTTLTSGRSFDRADELTKLVETQGVQTTKNLVFSFNANGDRTQQVDSVSGQTTNYSYDQADRLIKYGTWQYGYNGDGLRTSKANAGCGPSCSHSYTWDMGSSIPLLLQDGTSSYIYGPGGLLLEEVVGSTPYYYHADQLGSVRAVTNGSGTVANTYQYDAYGNVTGVAVSVLNPFGYAGEYTDSESGLEYLRARYYDPPTQQFLTVDPLLAETGAAYAYAGGSPLNATDPGGLCDPSNTAQCLEEMEGGRGSGGVRDVGTDTGVLITASGTSPAEQHWDYRSGTPHLETTSPSDAVINSLSGEGTAGGGVAPHIESRAHPTNGSTSILQVAFPSFPKQECSTWALTRSTLRTT